MAEPERIRIQSRPKIVDPSLPELTRLKIQDDNFTQLFKRVRTLEEENKDLQNRVTVLENP